MRQNQPSITAGNNVVVRAYESMMPECERIFYDPYAVYFLPDLFLFAKNRENSIYLTVSSWKMLFPGLCNSIIARTRFIDDCLTEAMDSGIRQLVVLGAGYDTRALRFEALKDNVTIFELDHPATQKVKLERIAKYVKKDLSHVRYIPFDFNKDALDEKLLANGYKRHMSALFIWEGVTYYMTGSAVDKTLCAIVHTSVPVNTLVFDYFPSSVANGTACKVEDILLREELKYIGEEIHFGIEPDQIFDFMNKRGFKVDKNLTSDDYKKIYFKGVNEKRVVSDIFLFAQASISGPGNK
ncbi:MAG: SAM-dependent methyltransferase [Desulfobacteraceae bacterium]|nr:SAM-dependent methyltransferase [Desulfobacteraceae bacterium]